ncbi:MAG: calcium-binding protein [Scytonema sp. PMC 1069.18]|nr:calcium-binding protein [Scytonema sp. PMC 1069.18]MEC4883749.1 calcium-binding protein [Scytonema sp. PMC 1070.18]
MEIITGSGNDTVIRPVFVNGAVFRSNDTINTGAGNDTINPGLGKYEYVDGGEGFDHLILDYSVGDTGGGMSFNTTYGTSGSASRSSGVPNTLSLDTLQFKNIEKFTITGTSKDDTIKTYYGNNVIKAGAGNDSVTAVAGTLDGGSGLDYLTLDLSTQKANLNLSNLTNINISGVVTAINFEGFSITTGSGNDIVTHSGIVNGTVLRTNDVIKTGAGNDIINAGLGGGSVNDGDTVYGGDGIDRLIVDYSVGDTGTGMRFNGSSTYGFAIRQVSSTNNTRLDFVGFHNIEEFTVTGTSKDDTINTVGGNDIINGGAGNDTINTAAGNDTIDGGAGNDTIDGGAGNDQMTGGTGNDTYIVDSTGDTVTETSTLSTEIDTIKASVTYTLGANQENLILTGSGAINGTGNSLNNNLTGNQGKNILNGGSGNDTLDGGNGDDTLDGGAGNDTLIASSGKDVMKGGTGNDTYIVSSLNDDIIIENAGEGIDTVQAPYTSAQGYTLGANLENLILIGGATKGTGNSLDNTLTGNSRNNTLSGEGGKDTLIGGDGNDTLIGGAGNDILTGGNGGDFFLYNTNAAFTSAAIGIDRIMDFVKGSDKIILDKTTFTALQSKAGNGFSIVNEFAVVSSNAAAAISEAKIVYNQSSGALFYNQNGVASGFGTGAEFANFTGKPLLIASDFVIQT